jgi:hypothetical protein
MLCIGVGVVAALDGVARASRVKGSLRSPAAPLTRSVLTGIGGYDGDARECAPGSVADVGISACRRKISQTSRMVRPIRPFHPESVGGRV